MSSRDRPPRFRRRVGTTLLLVLTGAAVMPAEAAAARLSASAADKPVVHTIGGCRVFPADNPWNTRIDKRPVWKHSASIVKRQATGHPIHLDLGTTEEYYGIPVTVVPRKQRLLRLRFGFDGENYKSESDTGPVPIPGGAPIEGGSSSAPDPAGGDRHVIVVRRGSCDLTELYKAVRVRNAAGTTVAWRAAAAARWDLGSNKLRPKFWTSADAAGLPILPGLLSYDEAASGAITHALRFTLPTARAAFTKPARHCGPRGNKANSLPAYGLRFRLKKSVRASRYTGPARTIVKAMKRYGLIYADQGSAMFVTGTSDPRWAKVLKQFRTRPINGSKFEVVKPSGKVTRCR